MGAAIQAERLLRDLDEVWVSLGQQQQEAGGVLRACAMTLVALIETGPQDAAEALAELMHDHPARAIIVRAGGEGELTARATAECWMPFGRRQQICCELIEISTPLASLGDVPAVLRGLMVPDLPVVLWVRHAALLRNATVAPFVDLAQKIIVEPRGFDDSRWLLSKLREISDSGKIVADLAWTRITRWRQTIARIFDDASRVEALAKVDEIIVRHSSHEPGPAAMYLAAWIRLSLGRDVATRFEQSDDKRVWQIQEVELRGGGFSLSISRTDTGVVAIRADGLKTCSVFCQLREADLLREELSISGPDVTFERVLRSV